MKKFIPSFFLTLLLFSTAIYAQQVGVATYGGADIENDPFGNYHQKFTPMMQKLFQQVRNNKDYINYELGSDVGSPYEDDTFAPGKVYYEDEYLGDFYYRHNAYNGEIELKGTLLEEEKQKALVQDTKVKLVTKTGTFQFLPIQNKKGQFEETYLRSLSKTKDYTLYERTRIKYTEGKEAANSMVNAIPSRFTQYTEYYYKHIDSDFILEIPTQKGKFIKLFVSEDKSKEVKSYMKSNETDLSNKEDLIKIFDLI